MWSIGGLLARDFPTNDAPGPVDVDAGVAGNLRVQPFLLAGADTRENGAEMQLSLSHAVIPWSCQSRVMVTTVHSAGAVAQRCASCAEERLVQQRRGADVGNRGGAGELHDDAQFLLELFEHPLHPLRAIECQTVEHRVPDRDQISAGGDGLEHIEAAADAAVEDERDATLHFGDHSLQ